MVTHTLLAIIVVSQVTHCATAVVSLHTLLTVVSLVTHYTSRSTSGHTRYRGPKFMRPQYPTPSRI